jgi:hypothetical protein
LRIFEQSQEFRALKLAQLVYEANGSLEHGALVAMALGNWGVAMKQQMAAQDDHLGKTAPK